jgi:hypothetical protein
MTKPKKVSATITNILENPIVQTILDRSSDITDVITEVESWWGYDLMNRKPSPAYDDYGIFKGTDLDLACFLYALVDRGAVINIPTYKGHSQKKIREDQILTSKFNRHGKLINVGGNKDFFSFNITIIDENVVGEDKVGAFRTFSLTDRMGKWYDGWKTIQFQPTMKENRFLTENELWTGNKIIFKHFIHPNRWTSVFGQHYIITRLLMDRLEDEAKFTFSEMKRIQKEGVEYPKGDGPAPFVATEYGETKRKTFPSFIMNVFIPDAKFSGNYKTFNSTQDDLVAAYRKRKYYNNKILPKLRFMTRASEYAHSMQPTRLPAWIKNVKWEPGFKLPRGRIEWGRLKLFQDKVGEHSISLLRRAYDKSATVSAD